MWFEVSYLHLDLAQRVALFLQPRWMPAFPTMVESLRFRETDALELTIRVVEAPDGRGMWIAHLTSLPSQYPLQCVPSA